MDFHVHVSCLNISVAPYHWKEFTFFGDVSYMHNLFSLVHLVYLLTHNDYISINSGLCPQKKVCNKLNIQNKQNIQHKA